MRSSVTRSPTSTSAPSVLPDPRFARSLEDTGSTSSRARTTSSKRSPGPPSRRSRWTTLVRLLAQVPDQRLTQLTSSGALLGHLRGADVRLGAQEAREVQEGVWKGLPPWPQGHDPLHRLKQCGGAVWNRRIRASSRLLHPCPHPCPPVVQLPPRNPPNNPKSTRRRSCTCWCRRRGGCGCGKSSAPVPLHPFPHTHLTRLNLHKRRPLATARPIEVPRKAQRTRGGHQT